MESATKTFNELLVHYPNFMRLLLVLGLVILYWYGYSRTSKFLNSKYPPKLATFINTWLLLIALVLTLATVLSAFSTNITQLLSSITFLSAALVFALQDFFANFMAWIYITSSDQYSIGDNILITSDNRVIYGTVKDIGIFRTTLIEKLGDNGLDTEMNTGRILTFPNRFIHKHSLTNYTKNHLLLQHRFNFTIPYSQDQESTRKVIEESVNSVYRFLELHDDTYLDPTHKNDPMYTPKLYTHLDDSGVTYTIWFACKAGVKRTVLDLYSNKILKDLNSNNIPLAFKTFTIAS
ncbi:MAG: mechanosensitive ion channel family protein [Patescibacteria group bacterium]